MFNHLCHYLEFESSQLSYETPINPVQDPDVDDFGMMKLNLSPTKH